MSPIFRSEGRVLVEEGDIPDDLVSTTVRGFVEERIELVRTRVFSDEHILELVDKHSLFMTAEQASSDRQKILLFEDSSAVNIEEMPDGTISFSVSYDDPDPVRARDVAEDLIQLFIAENVADRTQSASMAAKFLEEEADRLARQIADFEERLARYKEVNSGRLPEQVGLNIQLLDRAERELEAVGSEVRSLEQRRAVLESDIVRLNSSMGFGGEPPPPGSADRLRYLQAEYLRMLSIYSPQHPDLVRVKREIELLSPGGSGLTKRYIAEQIRMQELELADLRSRYSTDHPDVVRLSRSIDELNEEYRRAPESTTESEEYQDPEMMRLMAERDGIDNELSAQRSRRQELRSRISEYEDRLTNSPEIERELLDLTRGYDQLRQKYEDVKLKQTQVEMAVSVEQNQRAGRFAITASPRLPSSPAIPNRPAIIFLGLLAGLGMGLALVGILEGADKTIRDEFDVREAWGAPPICAIPEIHNLADDRRRVVMTTTYVLAIALFVISAALSVV